MGIDPALLVYPPGTSCLECNDVLFDGITPKYLLAVVAGIRSIATGLLFGSDVNAQFMLTQTSGCTWRSALFPNQLSFFLGIGQSEAILLDTDTYDIYFWQQLLFPCRDNLTNRLPAGFPGEVGSGGTIEFIWGPGVRG